MENADNNSGPEAVSASNSDALHGSRSMTKMTIDSDLCTRLRVTDADLELCDYSGHTVGFFVPPERHQQLLYAWAKTAVPEEELERARRQSGGQPLGEILAELETR
jgi:hypothetical protein